MKKKAKATIEVVAFTLVIWLLWNRDIPIGDNVAMICPFVFIYGLMYLILR